MDTMSDMQLKVFLVSLARSLRNCATGEEAYREVMRLAAEMGLSMDDLDEPRRH
ncbi:MAG: hypothetical protein LBR38_06810 [Synergistaceae bacterium]|jgi:hypothetical protein|nr:hypothetical protein [Synergistaceae bacterium]